MIAAKINPFTIPANGSFSLLAVGDYFKVLDATGTFEVTGDTFGTMGAIKAGQGLDNTPFARLTFRDTSGGANTLSVLTAGENFVDDRVTGEVSVIDASAAQVRAGQSFQCASNQTPAGGQLAHYELENLSATDFMEVVEIATAAAANQAVNYGIYTGADLGTVLTTPRSTYLSAGAVAADANAAFRYTSNAGSLLTDQIGSQYAPVATLDRNRPIKPLLIGPGQKLMIVGTAVATNVFLNLAYVRRPS